MVAYRFTGKNVSYTKDEITSVYEYSNTRVTQKQENGLVYEVCPENHKIEFKTKLHRPKTGVMLVGWGGCNGSTFTAVWLSNKHGLTWKTKKGTMNSNYLGSIVMSSTVCLGVESGTPADKKVYAPMHQVLPFLNPNDLEVDGWDISKDNLGDSMAKAMVIEEDLQEKLYPLMKDMVPRQSVFDPDYVSDSQIPRANHVLEGTLSQKLDRLRSDIRDFKEKKKLEKIIVVWTGSTEKMVELHEKVHTCPDAFMKAIEANNRDLISPSMLFCTASILEGCIFINGSPQNTLVEALISMAAKHKVFLAGDDFKTGQTKVKSVMVEFLLNSGLKPVSLVSYNHLGNNDGANLSSTSQFRSKEISKTHVIDDLIDSNPFIYSDQKRPDHCIVIRYVPYVNDSKRALDEYISEICMNSLSTIMIYNTCEDSLLAVPVMLDLVLLSDMLSRISANCLTHGPSSCDQNFQPVLSALGFMLKAPLTSGHEPLMNGLAAQRSCIENLIRACVGLPPQSNMYLEYKFGLAKCRSS